jgi:hypothetical protein
MIDLIEVDRHHLHVHNDLAGRATVIAEVVHRHSSARAAVKELKISHEKNPWGGHFRIHPTSAETTATTS